MDDVPPMRPVTVPPDERAGAAVWKMPFVFGVVLAAALLCAYVPAGSRVAWMCAIVFLVVGLGLFTASVVREGRENRGRRLRWWRATPVRPGRFDMFASLGAPVAGLATVILARDASILWWVPITCVVCVMFVVVCLLHWRHNRRLATTCDA